MRKLIYIFCSALPLASFSQSVQSQASTVINIPYLKTGLIEPSAAKVEIPVFQNPSVENGFGAYTMEFGISSDHYFFWTFFGSHSHQTNIQVSLGSSTFSNYFLLELVSDPYLAQNGELLGQVQSPITLSSMPQVWISGLEASKSGRSMSDGMVYRYRLLKNPVGSYGSLHGGPQGAVIQFTFSE